MSADVARDLAPLLRRRWLLLGIGSDLRGDDAFGPRLARRLAAAGRPAVDAGTAPENATGQVRRHAPEVLLLADAAGMGLAPGSVRLLTPGDLAEGGTGTHDAGLATLLVFLGQDLDLEVHVLAVEPASRALGAPVSAPVAAAEDRLAVLLGGA